MTSVTYDERAAERRNEDDAPRDRSLADDRGAIMVIAIFMSATLVGLIWYTLGMGEAMIYREQLRAASDAVAFDAATVHALGMNMVSMINITMAAVLAILLAVTVFLFIMIGITVLSVVCAALTLGLCAGVTADLVSFDIDVWNFCADVRKVVFGPSKSVPGVIPILNWTEGFIGILMPWSAKGSIQNVAQDYTQAVTRTDYFSPSMIPTRIPILSNYTDSAIDGLYQKTFPALIKKIPAASNPLLNLASNTLKTLGAGSKFKITDLQRFGLPIQEDKFAILCDHAGNELVQMLAFIIGSILGGQGQAAVDSGFAKSVSSIFGFVVSAAPGVFCSGADPVSMLVGGLDAIPIFGPLAAKTVSKWIKDTLGEVLETTPEPIFDDSGSADPFGGEKESWPKVIEESITSMKMFDMSENGNDWFAVYSNVKGNPSLTTGALTGVQVSTWGSQSASTTGSMDDTDGAQAEFYFDCGNTETNGNDEGVSFENTPPFGTPPYGWINANDSDPSWSICKYSANWNMRWKARLRRVHPFEYNVGDSIGVMLYNLSGIEGAVKKVLSAFQLGTSTEIKLDGLDDVKSDFKKWIDAVLPNGGVISGSGNPSSYH